MLWHGSNTFIEGQLIPHKSFHYEPLVYATADLYYALVRAGKFDTNKFLLKEDYDGDSYTLIELKENAIEEVFDTDGYIYAVNRNAARNELCGYCGQYKEAHTDACDGCKWRASE